MQEKIKEIQKEIERFSAKSAEELENLRIKFLSKKEAYIGKALDNIVVPLSPGN